MNCMRKDVCPKFIFYLDLFKVCGLVQCSGLNTSIDYITGYIYIWKGGENSVVWEDSTEDMLDTYI